MTSFFVCSGKKNQPQKYLLFAASGTRFFGLTFLKNISAKKKKTIVSSAREKRGCSSKTDFHTRRYCFLADDKKSAEE